MTPCKYRRRCHGLWEHTCQSGLNCDWGVWGWSVFTSHSGEVSFQGHHHHHHHHHGNPLLSQPSELTSASLNLSNNYVSAFKGYGERERQRERGREKQKIYICVCVCVYVCVFKCMCVSGFLCVSVSERECVCVCVCVCLCTSTTPKCKSALSLWERLCICGGLSIRMYVAILSSPPWE